MGIYNDILYIDDRANVSGLGNLGMATVNEVHYNLQVLFNSFLVDYCRPFGFKTSTETPSEFSAEREYFIFDIGVKNNFNENILFIEICHNGDEDDAISKCYKAMPQYPTIREAFVYNYDTKVWKKYTRRHVQVMEHFKCSYSDTLHFDLQNILMN